MHVCVPDFSISKKIKMNAFLLWCFHNRRDKVSGMTSSEKAEKGRDHLSLGMTAIQHFSQRSAVQKGGEVFIT